MVANALILIEYFNKLMLKKAHLHPLVDLYVQYERNPPLDF